MFRRPSHLALLIAAFLLALSASPASAAGAHRLAAQAGQGVGQRVAPQRFPGQVTALNGPSANPTTFALQDGDRSLDFQLVQRTMFTARSAEAGVEGFAVNDFAVVVATRTNTGWVANRVVYDVLPFGAIMQFTLTGMLSRPDRRGRSVILHLAGGYTHRVDVTRDTKLELTGLPIDALPPLGRDNLAEVHIDREYGPWTAILINIKQVGTPRPASSR